MQTNKASVFGRYEILTELGRGAMGIVYKAYDPGINRLVAIKTISFTPADASEDQVFQDRFFREAEASGRLSHPRIVSVFDVGRCPNTLVPYIVMEYVAGRSLEQVLSTVNGGLPVDTALRLTQEVAEGLDYAHCQGVVHRDVKPSNIIISEDGHAKIADFGIAQLDIADIGGSRRWGTPAYMSPEQLRGKTVDGRSDLFSLGVILYRMLTGHRPFQGNSALTVALKVQNQEPVPATAFNTELSPELDRVVARAVAKDPAERYQTGMEMILDLQRLRCGIDSEDLEHDVPCGPDDCAGLTLETNGFSYASLVKTTNTVLSGNGNEESKQAPSNKAAVIFRLDQGWQQVVVGFLTLGVLTLAFIGLWWVIPAPGSDEMPIPSFVPTASMATVVGLEAESANAHFLERAAIGVTRNARSAPLEKSASCQLGIAVVHHFTTANLSVWIDNHETYHHSLRGTTKTRVVLLKGVEGYLSDVVQLAPGIHQIRVRVLSADGSYDESGSISETFAAGSARLLRVDFDRHNRGMHLDFAPFSAR